MFSKRYSEFIPAQERRIMSRRLTIVALTALVVMALGGVVLMVPSAALAAGATQIEGIGVFDDGDVCDSESAGSDFALILTGDLVGCLYTFVETAVCSPSGTYLETGNETFIGMYKGGDGTFRTTYQFEAKYQDCPNLVGEIFGRCQHPFIKDSGDGVFMGATGRIDFKDDVDTGEFHYRGHVRY